MSHHRFTRAIVCVLALVALLPYGASAGDQCEPAWDTTVGVPGTNGDVRAMLVMGEGASQKLFVAGAFLTIGGITVNRIAEWSSGVWSALGVGANLPLSALIVWDDGSGPALFAAGNFTQINQHVISRIAKWNGSDWEPLGSGVDAPVTSMVAFDDGSGPALYVGGGFLTAGGNTSRAVARWRNGAWEALPGLGPHGASANTLAVYDDGAGPALYAAGVIGTAGGAPTNNIAVRRNGVWMPVGPGLNAEVERLLTYDDGGGQGLFATGLFTATGGNTTPLLRVAVWRGGAWSPLGAGVTNAGPLLNALHAHDDGAGMALYLGGQFTSAAGQGPSIARWRNGAWESVGAGVTGRVRCMASMPGPNGPILWVGGAFTMAGGSQASNLAQWVGCEPESGNPADLNGDGLVNSADLAALLGAWGPGSSAADINGDGFVNSADLAALLGAWG